jgi:PmbA protein
MEGVKGGLYDDIVSSIDEIYKRAFNLGASELEISVIETNRTRIDASKGNISRVTKGTSVTLGIRAVIGKKKGNAGGVVSRKEDIYNILNDAIKIAKVSKEDPHWPGFPYVKAPTGEVKIFDKRIAEAEPNKLVEIVRRSIEEIKSFKDVRHTETLLVTVSSRIFISNSHGLRAERSETLMTFYTGASSGTEGSYYDYHVGKKLEEDKIIEVSKNTGKRAREASEARPIETGSYRVILEPKVVSGILSSVLEPAFSAENVQQGRSPLKGKIGHTILNEKLTIKDDPFIPWNAGSTPFDDEGVPTKSKELVSKGVLNTYLYDTYTARRENKESTGNGFKRTPWSDPSPGPTNIVIEIDTEKLDSVIADTRKGIIVGLTIGEWLSNPISGMLNATVTFGYLVEQGSISRPIKGVIISGNLLLPFHQNKVILHSWLNLSLLIELCLCFFQFFFFQESFDELPS